MQIQFFFGSPPKLKPSIDLNATILTRKEK